MSASAATRIFTDEESLREFIGQPFKFDSIRGFVFNTPANQHHAEAASIILRPSQCSRAHEPILSLDR